MPKHPDNQYTGGYEQLHDGWVLHRDSMGTLVRHAVHHHLEHPNLDAVLNIETHLFNVTLVADNCEYDLDIGKEVWLTIARWSRLIKEYVPREAVGRFVSQSYEIISGGARLGATANMFAHDPVRHDKKHRWGGCLMGLVFRGDNGKAGPATLTMYSRTTYMGYMGLLDAAVAHVIARTIADAGYQHARGGLKVTTPGDISFRWHIGSQQLHAFKTLPYVYSQPELMQHLEAIAKRPKQLEGEPPTWREMAKWYRKVLEHWEVAKHNPRKMLDNEKYGPFKRIKRRWMEAKGYLSIRPPPSLPISEVHLNKAI